MYILCSYEIPKEWSDLENTSRLILDKVGNNNATPYNLVGVDTSQELCVRVIGVLHQEKKRKIPYLTA